ncbi:hypothetical protein MIND_00391100 [Mycena indigotica]|uniref:C2H2-type domain-containing protein n=1 Tax=Mycena indigotica TaxID=2126181 RepID=A0A8H6T1A6_9AGAR|nr:uncharacterized protein MIND_00391100 [Mycena indigotica]KAF7310175.1 hypothetical protein MIND_00391100 [Mycena indigotica]
MLDQVLGFLGRLLPDDIPTSDDADGSTTDNETPAGFENLPLFHASTLRSIEIGRDNTGNIAYFDKPSAPSSLHLSHAKETTVKHQKLTKADRSAVVSSRKVIATSSESDASEDSVTSGEGNLRRPWNPRPDGQFTRKVSRAWYERHKFTLHGAWEGQGRKPADIPGSRRAEKPEDGWHSVRKCLGVMKCVSNTCGVIIRPQTKQHGRDRQLSRGCSVCHGKIIEHKCRVKCESWVYRTGAIFKHHGIHHHDNAPAIHLSQREDRNFQQIVHEHPRMGPVKLLTGRPGINGPGDSVANISPVLDNPGRIQYERRKLIKPAIRLNSKYFLPALEKLRQENPEWTISYEGSNGVQLVILQSNWQRRMAVKNSISTEAVNGIVTDACHDFFTERTHLLFLSSTFEAQFLKCWIPILICFSNGASAEHYRLFFAFLFAAIVARCKEKGIKFIDEFLANVVDFSQAQSKGFSGAYVDLRRSQGSKWTNKTDSELAQIGGALLKGCLQHFSNQITRVAKISHVVPPGQQARFRELAQRMLRAKDLDQLHAFGNDLMTAFEHASPWAEWWLRADHARMLFAAAREMDPAIAMSLPDTTNAAEAMNSRIYAMAERKNQLVPGLAALIRVGDTFERRYYAAKAGNKIFYGADPQHWKKTKAVFGYTKHTRHQSGKKTVSDGRPPDTIATLQAASRKGKKMVADQYQRAYKWDQHSCSIDSSLTAIYSALSRNPTWIRRLQDALPMPHIIHSVAMLLEKQISQSSHTAYEPNGCAELTRGRDQLRLQLVKIKAMRGVGLSDSILGWLNEILADEIKKCKSRTDMSGEIALSLFRAQAVIVKKCQGESPTATEHWEVTNPFWRSPFRLSQDDHHSHGGDLEKWMKWVMLPKQWTAVACWRQADGGSLCAGLALSKEFIIEIPIVLTVELGEDGPFSWIIPSHLAPLGPTFATAGLGVRYSLCAVIFTNHTEKRGDNSHFFTRYHAANSNAMYDYDGMKHSGHAIRLTGKKLARWMTGLSSDFQSIPEGYRPMAIVYHLDGGETAQRVFREQRERTAPCGLQLGRSLSTDRFWSIARLEDANHLEEMTVDERGVWAGTRHRAETREYTRDINSSPVKLTKRDHEKGLKSLANHLAAPSTRIMITDTSSESDRPIAVRKARRKITKTAKVQSTPERTEPEDKRQPFSYQHRETRLLQPKSYTSSFGIPHVRKTRDLRPNFAKSSQSDDSVNEFLLKSAAFSSPKAAPSLSEDTDSETPCILNCCSCGELGLDDTDDMCVQCSKCRFWSHEACLRDDGDYNRDQDWHDPSCDFVCKHCIRPIDLFYRNEIVLLPKPPPGVPWSDSSVIWYPARVKNTSINRTREQFTFRYINGIVWPEPQDPLARRTFIPPMTTTLSRQVCKEIIGHPIKPEQVCCFAVPSFLTTTSVATQQRLQAIFSSAVVQLAELLRRFPPDHPVIHSYLVYFDNRPASARDHKISDWLESAQLTATPELEEAMRHPLEQLCNPKVVVISGKERKRRVMAVGNALLQLLALQDEMDLPLDLNGATFQELVEGKIFPLPWERDHWEMRRAMLLATRPPELIHKSKWSEATLAERLTEFNRTHIVEKGDFRPSRFYRSEPEPGSDVTLEPIPISAPPKQSLQDVEMLDTVSTAQAKPPSQVKRKRVPSDDELIPVERLLRSRFGEFSQLQR